MSKWAIDLGTTNTAVGKWDESTQRPVLLNLSQISRRPTGQEILEAPRVVPSSTHMLPERDFMTRLGSWSFFAKRFFFGRQALIGREALEKNEGFSTPNFVPSFKPYLGREALRVLSRCGGKSFTARDVARTFMRELLMEVKEQTKERIRDLVITVPVDSFESYRAELIDISKHLGIKRIRFLDEPVAAAIGYGLSPKRKRYVLVLDFGGGTLDLALVSLTAREMQDGHCEVIAKAGRAIGGNLVDQWILEDICKRIDYPLEPETDNYEYGFWLRMMLNEARRVKESVYFKPSETFCVIPPEELRHFEARLRGEAGPVDITRDDLIDILKKNQLYEILESCLENVLEQAKQHNVSTQDIEEVLMVGGSTLLPDIYPLFEERFGRDKVRAWQPFEAVAYGACAFAADNITQSDFIVHDYAILTYDLKTHKEEYNVIVPKGTRFPTPKDFWKRQLVPTCALGEPETIFKLVICELSDNSTEDRKFGWDAQGYLHQFGGEKGDTERLIVPLNEANPALGQLKPPHKPSDRTARLRISFGVNEDRWLSATVFDLHNNKYLMREEPVVRLL